MTQSLPAVIAIAIFGIVLSAPADASARAGAARGSRSVGAIHHGGMGFVRKPVVHHHGFGGRGRTVARRGAGRGWSGYGVGGDGYEGDAGAGGYGGTGCRWERMQIDDDYGWRVRNVMFCPGGSAGGRGPIAPK